MSIAAGLLASPKFVRQAEAGECGLACLAMIARHHGDKDEIATLRRRFPLSARGCSLKDLISIAEQMGFHTRALKSDIPSLHQLALPVVLHWDLNHYVVLDRVRRGLKEDAYTILDPAQGERMLSAEKFGEHFTGIVLELTPGTAFRPSSRRTRLQLSQLWTKIRGLAPALTRIMVLSVVMQIVALVMPFYTQLAIDTALPGADFDLLNILALGFSGLILLSAGTAWVRNRLVLSLSSSLGLQTAINLFRHTVFLPISWFEKRHLGDVTSRFASLQPIAELLSRGLVSAVVDGVLAATTLCLMLIYSPLLASLTIGVVLLYGLIKLVFFNSMKMANVNLLSSQALETSAFIENVRGIAAIKMFCQEGNRQRQWQNRKADVVNGTIKLGRITAGFDAANAFVVGIENVLFVLVAIKMVLTGAISLGMVFAFQAYKQSFVGAITRLIDQLLLYRLLDVHLDRISDIALEQGESMNVGGAPLRVNRIRLENVSFSYGLDQPPVLRNVTLDIEPSRTTVIVGPSGSGKSTLFKILCGLLQPTSGRVLVDGVPLEEVGARLYRGRLGVVSQEDSLFSGSLAENIAFFDPDYEIEKVVECCKRAQVHDDIMHMPMKYETTVGDNGGNLSGGQKQRILLARALYHAPDVLMLDEGTSQLDVSTEAGILAAIKQQAIARVLVAHRPETIRSGDVLYQVIAGRCTRVLPMEGVKQTILEPSSTLSESRSKPPAMTVNPGG